MLNKGQAFRPISQHGYDYTGVVYVVVYSYPPNHKHREFDPIFCQKYCHGIPLGVVAVAARMFNEWPRIPEPLPFYIRQDQEPYPAEPLGCSLHTIWWNWPYPNPVATIWTWYRHLGEYDAETGESTGAWDSCFINAKEEVMVKFGMLRQMGYRSYIEWHDQHNYTQTYYPWGYSYPDDPNFWTRGKRQVVHRNPDGSPRWEFV